MTELTQVSTNGNGHVDVTSPLPSPVRVCPECSGPVPEDRKVTCSSECAQKRDRRKGRPSKTLNRRTAPSSDTTPAVEIRGTGLGTLAAALLSLDELAEIESVTVTLADQVLTIRLPGVPRTCHYAHLNRGQTPNTR